MSENLSFDVVIVGGGAIGAAVAYFLKGVEGFSGSVALIERDPTFRDRRDHPLLLLDPPAILDAGEHPPVALRARISARHDGALRAGGRSGAARTRLSDPRAGRRRSDPRREPSQRRSPKARRSRSLTRAALDERASRGFRRRASPAARSGFPAKAGSIRTRCSRRFAPARATPARR